MPVTLLENTGAQVIVEHDYHELTLQIITAEKNAGQPRPTMIYEALDAVIRDLKASPALNTAWIDIIEDPENAGQPKLVYSVPEIEDATIIAASYESTILDERVTTQININTTTAIVTVNLDVAIGGKIKITYKS